jgi:hypothetical protein
MWKEIKDIKALKPGDIITVSRLAKGHPDQPSLNAARVVTKNTSTNRTINIQGYLLDDTESIFQIRNYIFDYVRWEPNGVPDTFVLPRCCKTCRYSTRLVNNCFNAYNYYCLIDETEVTLNENWLESHFVENPEGKCSFHRNKERKTNG